MTRYGTDVLVIFLSICLALAICDTLFVDNLFVRYAVLLLLGGVTFLALNFFRDPDRQIPSDQHIAVSPADGKIVRITSFYEPEFLREEVNQVSIFMSPIDVHVNRIPVSGTISYLRYTRGSFVAAFADKASDLNENMTIGIEREGGGKVLFKQIAGTVARRIVADLRLNQKVAMGDRFGMIKFGSRVDIFFPKTATINVRMHQRVWAGESILATYPPIT
jgi:phosphatidylserine decarboxylase